MSKGPRCKTTRFSCGHRGKGAYCHRCRQADELEARVATLNKTAQAKEGPGARHLATLTAEAIRLRKAA